VHRLLYLIEQHRRDMIKLCFCASVSVQSFDKLQNDLHQEVGSGCIVIAAGEFQCQRNQHDSLHVPVD